MKKWFLGLLLLIGSSWVACQSPAAKADQQQRALLKHKQRKADSLAATRLLDQLKHEAAPLNPIQEDSMQNDSLRR